MSGQGIGEHVVGTLLPDSVQLVLAKFQHEALQSGVFDLVECVAVDDRDRRTMVGVDSERHTGQKQLARERRTEFIGSFKTKGLEEVRR